MYGMFKIFVYTFLGSDTTVHKLIINLSYIACFSYSTYKDLDFLNF